MWQQLGAPLNEPFENPNSTLASEEKNRRNSFEMPFITF